MNVTIDLASLIQEPISWLQIFLITIDIAKEGLTAKRLLYLGHSNL